MGVTLQNYIEWSDDKIIQYLKEYWGCDDFVFDCTINNEPFKTKNPELFKGSITNISFNGTPICYPNSTYPVYYNIPVSTKAFNNIGSFKIRFELDYREKRLASGNMFMIRPVISSYTELNKEKIRLFNQEKIRLFNQKKAEAGKEDYDEDEKKLFARWGVKDTKFIGFYNYDENTGLSTVSDLRKPNFAKIPYYPNDPEKTPITLYFDFPIKNVTSGDYYKSGDYYLFNWKLAGNDKKNPYKIYIDFSIQPQPIRPHWFIDQLFDDRHNDISKNFESSANFLDTLSKQLSAKESTFIYELLQNANDYPKHKEPVDVEFHITKNYLLFMHTGDFFNVRNISGICGINEKEKTANKNTIGYKGIGFKTVFLNNHYVYIKTGDYSFRFDEKSDKIERLEAPWPILPIWTDEDEVPVEVSRVFDHADTKFRVKIALRPDNPSILHSGRKNYEDLFKEVFNDSNLILFIPNIRSVKVFINGVLARNCVIDESKWIVSDYEESINQEFQALVNKDIDTGKSRIPEKYKDFDRTKVSFACKREGRKLIPIDKSILYCYLPTSASWGFPFLMNTDMIPKGDRDDIEREVYLKDEDETNFNLELARIAGEKFFWWIKELMESGKYDYDSVFSLIPNFKQCIKEFGHKYDDFITKFQEGFESRLHNESIIPVVDNKTFALKPIDDVIYDSIGISCTGFIKDEELLSISEWQDWFPHPLLRDFDKHSLMPGVKDFLSNYHNEKQRFGMPELHEAFETEGFQKWLSLQANNNKILGFLLKKNIISYFNDSNIFLDEKGCLYSPNKLYYSVDDYYDDIKSLDKYIDRLSLSTRAAFEGNKTWMEFCSRFKEFDTDTFVDKVLFDKKNFNDVHDILSKESALVPFMRFLSANVKYDHNYQKLPFLDQNGDIINSFLDRQFLFLNSTDIIAVRSEKWIDADWIGIVSDKYDPITIDYLKQNFEVVDFDDKIIIHDLICNYEYECDINDRIDSFEVNKSFVNYLYKHKEYIDNGELSGFNVSAINKDGVELSLSKNEEHIYIRNKNYDEYEALPWIDADMMYSLNESYFVGLEDPVGLKTFFKDKYDISAMNSGLFLHDIVLQQKNFICSDIKETEINIQFWRWVKSFTKDKSQIPNFTFFPLLVKELDEDDYKFVSIKDIGVYLSNEYQPSSGIETIVKKYAPDALFIVSDYLEDSRSSTVTSWVEFFKNLGVKTTIVDLLFEKIIPNIRDLQEDGLPVLLGQYYNEIQDKWDEVKTKLKSIKVKTNDGLFTPIKDSIIVDVNKDKEPFLDIIFKKEIYSAAITTRYAKKLLIEIAEEAQGSIIKDVVEWQELKFNVYAGHERDYSIETHMHIIKELSSIDVETIKKFKNLSNLKLLNQEDEYCLPHNLTLGTLYNPACQFEKNGVLQGLDFVSNKYSNISEGDAFVNLAKKVLRCHYLFEETDLSLLSNYKFCVYFWSEYAPRHYDFVEGLIEKDAFHNVLCVPTMAGNVYAPSDVYSRIIKEYVVNKVTEWEDKLPTTDIPDGDNEEKDLFKKLSFKEQLCFRDGLNALQVIRGKDKRERILHWMIDDYDDNYSNEISGYRSNESAIWKNGKGEDKPISELYALAPESKILREFFRDNEYVLNSDYIPDWRSNDEYRAICNMMQIPIIEEKDMAFEPEGLTESKLNNYFIERLLVVSAIEDPEKWRKSFDKYRELVAGYEFWCCSTISWKYLKNTNIYQNNKKFYAKDGKYYFVKDWCNRHVFSDFMRILHDDLRCDLNQDQFLSIMDPDISVEESLEPYHSLRTDEFIEELSRYNSDYVEYSGPMVEEDENEDDDNEGMADWYNPTRYIIQEKNEVDDESDTTDEESVSEDTLISEPEEKESELVELPIDKAFERNSNKVSKSELSSVYNDGQKEKPLEPIPGEVEGHHRSGCWVNDYCREDGTPVSGHWRSDSDVSPHTRESVNSLGTSNDDKSIRKTHAKNPEKLDRLDAKYEDNEDPLGSVDNDKDFDKLGQKPYKPRARKWAKPFTKEEIERLRSHGTPFELESLPPTEEEINILSQCGINPEQIADTNYLAQLRLYNNLKNEMGEEPEESLEDFVKNADDVSVHPLHGGRFVRAYSAARGVMYVSPSVWRRMIDDKWAICVYLNGQGSKFKYINNKEEFLQLVEKDDVVIKITGKEKVDVVNAIYSGILENKRSTAYTLIRVAAQTNMDAVFAHYIGAMAEPDDGNDDNEYGE